VIFFKVFLSLDQLASSMTRRGANSLAPAVSSGAIGLPIKSRRHGCKVVKAKMFAESSRLGVEWQE
jgi:hypothetical protein